MKVFIRIIDLFITAVIGISMYLFLSNDYKYYCFFFLEFFLFVSVTTYNLIVRRRKQTKRKKVYLIISQLSFIPVSSAFNGSDVLISSQSDFIRDLLLILASLLAAFFICNKTPKETLSLKNGTLILWAVFAFLSFIVLDTQTAGINYCSNINNRTEVTGVIVEKHLGTYYFFEANQNHYLTVNTEGTEIIVTVLEDEYTSAEIGDEILFTKVDGFRDIDWYKYIPNAPQSKTYAQVPDS